jgi:hypothetical protein
MSESRDSRPSETGEQRNDANELGAEGNDELRQHAEEAAEGGADADTKDQPREHSMLPAEGQWPGSQGAWTRHGSLAPKRTRV